MKTLVLLVHGFNVKDWRNSVGNLRPYFDTYEEVVALPIDYGWVGLWGLKKKNKKTAKLIVETAKNALLGSFDRVIAIGHSNGCAILYQAVERGAPISKLVFINPALDKTVPFSVPTDIWYSPSDTAVKYSKYVPNFFVKCWGEMGRVGALFCGDDIHNYNKEEDYPVCSKGHSDIFEEDKLVFFGPLISDKALK